MPSVTHLVDGGARMWIQPDETVKPALLSLRHTGVYSDLSGGGDGRSGTAS